MGLAPSPAIVANGRLITFEGGEGSGKSTQLSLLAKALAREPVVTREPGGTPLAEKLRATLLSGAIAPLGSDAEAIAFAAARADHVDRVIAPALERGEIVLCDRYVDSSRAYQRNVGQLMNPLQRLAVGAARPDLTLIYDLPPEEGIARVRARDGVLDRFEASALDELRERRAVFLEIARFEPERCAVIDASGSIDEVHGRTLHAVRDRMPSTLKADHDR